jgi:hypothetical protein
VGSEGTESKKKEDGGDGGWRGQSQKKEDGEDVRQALPLSRDRSLIGVFGSSYIRTFEFFFLRINIAQNNVNIIAARPPSPLQLPPPQFSSFVPTPIFFSVSHFRPNHGRNKAPANKPGRPALQPLLVRREGTAQTQRATGNEP